MRGVALLGLCSLMLVTGLTGGAAAAPADGPSGERAKARKLSIDDITPRRGEKVGTGMPIMLRFTQKIRNKKAVERALVVKSTKSTEGAWFWTTSSQGTSLAIFRPKTEWKPNQKVTVTANLKGV